MVFNNFIFFFFIFITSLVFLFFTLTKKRSNFDGRKLPPAPPKLPLIGNLHQIGDKPPHKSLLDLSKKYGDLMLLQLGLVPTLVISSAKTAQEIFKNHDLAFSSRPSLYAAARFTKNLSISFSPYGEYWREVRKIAVLELLSTKRVESYQCVRAEEVALMINEIEKARSFSSIDLSSFSFNLANTVISRVAFGRRNDLEFEELMQKVQTLAAEFNIADYFPWLSFVNRINGVDTRIDKCRTQLDLFLDQVISEHRNRRKHESDSDVAEDTVDVLLNVHKELTMDQIKGILLDVFVAATDTSSATTVWTMTELMRNPEIFEKLQREVREIGAGKESIDEKDLPKLAYLRLVIKESLRLHAPAPLLVPRETTEACNIGEKWVVPAKTRVIINNAALSMDPEYWEKPELFWPERFSNSKIDYKGQHFGYLPFGTGRRICPGMNFGIQLVELALSNLVFRYDWELPDGMKPEDIDMEEAIGITMHKKVPLKLIAKPLSHFK